MAGFPRTRWSLVVRLGGADEARGRRALEELCEAYWAPLYAFLRARGLARDEAQETVQGFFAAFLERRGFDHADRDRGRLRTYLLSSLRNYLAHRREYDAATKRGRFVTDSTAVDVIDATVADEGIADAEQVFMRAWARRVLEATLAGLRQEYDKRGKAAVFDALSPSLVETPSPEVATSTAARLGLSPGAAKVALHRLRARFGDRLRHQVADTVDDSADIDAELRALIAVMADL